MCTKSKYFSVNCVHKIYVKLKNPCDVVPYACFLCMFHTRVAESESDDFSLSRESESVEFPESEPESESGICFYLES